MIKLLLENKMVDINRKDEFGRNALFIAAKHANEGVMRVLLAKGIRIYQFDKDGNNVLHFCARYERRFSILNKLVKLAYDLELVNSSGDTAIHIAACKGNIRSLKCLLDAGAQINKLNSSSLSPLYLAILN